MNFEVIIPDRISTHHQSPSPHPGANTLSTSFFEDNSHRIKTPTSISSTQTISIPHNQPTPKSCSSIQLSPQISLINYNSVVHRPRHNPRHRLQINPPEQSEAHFSFSTIEEPIPSPHSTLYGHKQSPPCWNSKFNNPHQIQPTPINIYKQSTIKVTHQMHRHSNPIDVRRPVTRRLINAHIHPSYHPTDENTEDVLTKPIYRSRIPKASPTFNSFHWKPPNRRRHSTIASSNLLQLSEGEFKDFISSSWRPSASGMEMVSLPKASLPASRPIQLTIQAAPQSATSTPFQKTMKI
jgi:hypothetical protein